MNILVSSCLLGEYVRYDGNHNKIDSLESILSAYNLIPFCPEVEGGLPIPREPAEIINNTVLTKQNQDVTQAFEKGAQKALALCIQKEVKVALLKAKSPSCGNTMIYDGSFSGRLIEAQGITAKLLSENGIKVFNETQLKQLEAYLKTIGQVG